MEISQFPAVSKGTRCLTLPLFNVRKGVKCRLFLKNIYNFYVFPLVILALLLPLVTRNPPFFESVSFQDSCTVSFSVVNLIVYQSFIRSSTVLSDWINGTLILIPRSISWLHLMGIDWTTFRPLSHYKFRPESHPKGRELSMLYYVFINYRPSNRWLVTVLPSEVSSPCITREFFMTNFLIDPAVAVTTSFAGLSHGERLRNSYLIHYWCKILPLCTL